MHSIFMFLRQLITLPYHLFAATVDYFSSMWGENPRNRSLLLGMPAILAMLLCLATLTWANLSSQPGLETKYDGLAQAAKQRATALSIELNRERRVLGAPPTDGSADVVASDQSDIRQKKLDEIWLEERVYLQKLIALNPLDPDYKYRLAEVYLKQGDLQRGMSMMRSLAPANEAKFGKAHFWMANFIANQQAANPDNKRKLWLAALKQLDNCLVRDNANIQAQEMKAALLMALKRPREAGEIYEELFVDNPFYYSQLLKINIQLNQSVRNESVIDKALIKYFQKIRSSREDTEQWVDAWQHYDNLLIKKFEFETAESELLRELARYAEDPGRKLFLERQLSVIYSYWASRISQQGNTEEVDRQVLDKLKKSIEYAPRNEDALRQLTNLANRSLIGDQALEVYDPSQDKQAPASVYAEMGTYALTNADYASAIQYFEYARKKNPRDSRVLNNLAYTYLVCENRNPERALNLTNDALRYRPVDVKDASVYRSHFLHTRGLALMQLDQLDEAAANFEVALQDRSDSENILKDLVKCYEGRMEDQAEIYRRKLAEVQRRKANAVGERAPSSEQKSQDQ